MKIGILGGGQLARMLALAGHPLGVKSVILDPAPDACASAVSEHIVGDYDDCGKLEELASRVDAVTYEFENVPAESVKYLSEMKLPVYPPTNALAVSRDRLKEKTLFRELGIPVPDFAAVNNINDLKEAANTIGLPAVLKTRTMGYDGKGQTVIRSVGDIDAAWENIGGAKRQGGTPAGQNAGKECILESFVTFTREISVVAVRDRGGNAIFYPVSENTHCNGILHYARCRVDDPMQKTAEDYAARILEHFDYVGVLALELFDTGGTLAANEIAPRVHNTGHWTIEGARTSQFENHVRAVAGLPLGDTSATGYCGMVNFVGNIPAAGSILKIKGAHFHDYGKAVKPGRKVGHVTVCGDDGDDVIAKLNGIISDPECRLIK